MEDDDEDDDESPPELLSLLFSLLFFSPAVLSLLVLDELEPFSDCIAFLRDSEG